MVCYTQETPAMSPREAKLMCEPNVPPVNAPTETTAYL